MSSTNDSASIAAIREQVRRFLRERTIENIIEEISRGELKLADIMEEIYLCHGELRMQQDALRDSQSLTDQLLARFVQLYRNLPVPTLLLSLDGVLKDHNTAASETLAIDCTRFSQLATPRHVQTLEHGLRKAQAHGHADCTEVTLRSARYDTLIADLRLFLLPGMDHGTPEIICTLIDQTDRIAQRRALISTAEVVDASTTVAVRWEAKPGWPLVYASENVRHWGFPLRAFASGYVHLIDLVHPDDREHLEAVFTEAIAQRRPHFTLTCRLIWADNSVHWVELETSTQRVEGGGGTCYQGLIRDVTEREQAQGALRQQLRFQGLVVDISALFANSLRTDLDRLLDEALARIGRFFGVDRCYLHRFQGDDGEAGHAHCWWTEPLRADQERRGRVEAGRLDLWLQRLRETDMLCVPDVMRLPPEDDALRFELTRLFIRSRLLLPLNSEGRMLAALGFDTLVKPRAWSEEEIRLLRLLGETIASVLMRQRIEHERQTSETELKRLALVVEQSPSIVVMTDLSGIIEYVNERFCEVTGYTREEVRGRDVQLLKANEASEVHWSELWRTIQNGQTWRGEFQNRKKSGEIFWEQALITPVRDERGVVSHFVKLGEDVSDKKALTERLSYLVHYDPLTGLPNRALMRERIDRALARARRKGHGLALLSIDLDRLKLINDNLGHAAGDRLLREVAQRLQGLLDKEDTLARLGGDNFVLLVGRLNRAQDAAAWAEQARTLIEEPVALAKSRTRITASIGIALYPEDAATADDLIGHADAALHKAQSEGRRLYRFYTPVLNDQLREQFQLEQALRHGLEHDELLLYYQPRVDIRTGKILSLEALVRWRHPEWGLVEPSRFIPIAEATGLILDLGPVVLRQACRQITAWQDAGLSVVPVAVNLSAKELYQEALSRRIQEIMTDTHVDPRQLELEITESATMHSVDEAIEILSALRGLGLALSMDDFGTGQASLSYLNRLPMQTIKIDRSFLLKIGSQLEKETQSATIVKAIIGLGLNLGLHIIAEGVETPAQRDFLIEHGCHVAQGHLFSVPLPAEEISPLLKNGCVSTRLH